MITAHVLAVRVSPDQADCRVAATVAARGGVEDRRNPDSASSARRTAASTARPGEALLGGPGPTRGAARPDTQSAVARAAAAGHPGHGAALAPRHRPPPLGRKIHARKGRPACNPAEHPGPGPATGPQELGLGVPQNSRRDGRPRGESRSVYRLGNPQGQRQRPHPAADRADLDNSCAPRPTRSWPATSSQPTCSTAPAPTP